MKQKVLYIYVERIVTICKMMTLNSHVIKSPQAARNIFVGSLLSHLHYGIETVDLIDDIIEIDLIKTCESNMLLNYNFSISDALVEYGDSIMKTYLKATNKSLYKFYITNYF